MSARLAPFLAPSGAALTADERAMSRDEILRLQRILASLGFNDGGQMVPDGVIGPRTRAAVTAYQRARGLRVDGLIGPQVVSALNAEPAASGTAGTPAPSTPTPTPTPSAPAAPAPNNTPATTTPSAPSAPAPSTANAASTRSNWPLALGVGVIVVGGAYLASRESSRRKGK